MKRIKVVVTADDVKKGRRSAREIKKLGITCGRILRKECAIARAIQRTFNDPSAEWCFGAGNIKDHRIKAVAHQKVRNWVERHDSLKPIKPFSFFVEDLDQYNKKSLTGKPDKSSLHT